MKQERQKEEKKVNGVAPEEDVLSIQKSIALRACELYLQRGGVDGYAEDDWLQAEREILKEVQH